MPNWVTNELVFPNQETANRAKRLMKTELSPFDFNALKRMPQQLIDAKAPVDRTSVAWFLSERNTKNIELPEPFKDHLTFILTRFDATEPDFATLLADAVERASESKEKDSSLYAKGKTYVENLEHYGYCTWYEWALSEWGSKWNAAEVGWNDDPYPHVLFDTAWSAPAPIVRALAVKLNAPLYHRYADEDIGSNYGEYIFFPNGQAAGTHETNNPLEKLAIIAGIHDPNLNYLYSDDEGNICFADEDTPETPPQQPMPTTLWKCFENFTKLADNNA